jgi:hypothetical protein
MEQLSSVYWRLTSVKTAPKTVATVVTEGREKKRGVNLSRGRTYLYFASEYRYPLLLSVLFLLGPDSFAFF